MLERVDLSKKLKEKEYKKMMKERGLVLAGLQRKCRDLGIPIMVVFEGWDGAGKGVLINDLIQPMDPRGFEVFTIHKETEEERMRPFLWRYWTKTPAKGRMAIYDGSWYRRVLEDKLDGLTSSEQLYNAYDEIHSFEQQLSDSGTVIMKFFLHISQKEQKHRLDKLSSDKNTAWLVSKKDYKHNKKYDAFLKMTNRMLEKTDTMEAPWHIVEATDRFFAAAKITEIVTRKMEEAIAAAEQKAENKKTMKKDNSTSSSICKTSILDGVNLSHSLTKDEYNKLLAKYQSKLQKLHNIIYMKRIPVVIAMEGWDAGGKGGAIKRLTGHIDPRGYKVIPTAAPNDIERAHHYLWRFWNDIPKAGHIAIFDRTWYGRVLVERIEGFCSKKDWKRAYKEINDMEEHMANSGMIVLKFWMHIDQDEQERRFNERLQNPEKQWKITEEDWRNRDKWNEYKEAVDEMILRTSTSHAPWTIIEGNDKYYARIKVLETVIETLEKYIG